MPQLPSGRHAGLRPLGFESLWQNVQAGKDIDVLFSIRSLEDIQRYVEIIELIPDAKNGSDVLRPGSIASPTRFKTISLNITLDRLDELAAIWPTEDCQAFAAFLKEPRVRADQDRILEGVRELQQRYEKYEQSSEAHTLAGILQRQSGAKP